jgi:predicted PurR-regulated permease PerM
MTTIQINLKTFFIGALAIGSLFLAYQLRSLFLIFFVSFIIFSTLKPIIDLLEKKGFKRISAIVLVYILFFLISVTLFFLVINGVVIQLTDIVQNLSIKEENISEFVYTNLSFLSAFVDLDTIIESLLSIIDTDNLKSITSPEAFKGIIETFSPVALQGVSFITKSLSGLLTIFMILFLSMYMVLPKKDFYEGFFRLFPKNIATKSDELLDQIRVKLGAWVIGQLILMLAIGVATYFIILLPGIFIQDYRLGEFALIIAIIAGILEAIPNIGPLLTLIIAVFMAIATGSSLPLILFIVVMFTLLQQIESLFIVPVVMKKAIDIHPILSILSVLAGFELGGPIGALLAVPIIGVVQIIAIDFLNRWKNIHD